MEFAFVAGLLMLLVFGAIQLALVINAAVSVAQLAREGARFAAVNPTLADSDVVAHMLTVASPTITENGGSDLSVALNPPAGSPLRIAGNPITVTITYNLASKLLLPSDFMGATLLTSLPPFSATTTIE